MASLFDMDSSSDSEADVDYEPVADEISSDEEPLPSSDEEEPLFLKKSKTKQKKSVTDLESKKTAEDSVPVTSTVDEKKRADDIYKSFLDEVAAEKNSKMESASSSVSCYGSTTSSPVALSNTTSSPSVMSSATESPVVLSSDKSSVQNAPEKLFEFAGEIISGGVSNDVIKSVGESDSSSISCSKVVKNVPTGAAAPPVVKRKGLESVLGTIQNKKQKITVMQKSMLDWQSFKKDENLGQELEQFNRGKGGFIERQRFLQRSDLRSYEIERDMRISKRPTQQKRDV